MQKKGRSVKVPKQTLSQYWIIRCVIKLFDWMQKKGRSFKVSKQTLSQYWIIRCVIKLFDWMQKKGRSVEVPKQTLSQWYQHWIDLASKSANASASASASASVPDPASAPDTASAPALVSSPPFVGPPPVAALASDAGNEKQSSVLFNDYEFLNALDTLNTVPNDAEQFSALTNDDIVQSISDDFKKALSNARDDNQESASFNDENDATKWKTAFIELTLGWARYCYQVNCVYQGRITRLTTKLADSSKMLTQEERTTVTRLVDGLHQDRLMFMGMIDNTEARLRKILPKHVVNRWIKLFYSVFTNASEVETKLVVEW